MNDMWKKFEKLLYVKLIIALICMSPCSIVNAGKDKIVDDDGFLLKSYEHGEYIDASPFSGRWTYVSDELSVEITKHTQIEPAIVWFESEVKVRGNTQLFSYLSPGKIPGRRGMSPITLARDNQLVLAISDDFFSSRLNEGRKAGIIVRNGKIISDQTYKADQPSFPNLEVIARFKDGSLKTYQSNAFSSQEYLDMGATDVFAFGPILVSEGKLGSHMQDNNYYHYREPRCAIGMIAPNHYMILTVKGRSEDSKGVYLSWLAERMQTLGVTEALNLDGGGSVALIFMGEMLNKAGSSKSIRGIGGLIGFGVNSSIYLMGK